MAILKVGEDVGEHFALDEIADQPSITMMARVRLTGTPGAAGAWSVFNFFSVDGAGSNLRSFFDENRKIALGAYAGASLVDSALGTTVLPDTNVHLTQTFDTTTNTLSFYINGALEASLVEDLHFDDISFFGSITDVLVDVRFESVKVWVGAALSPAEILAEIPLINTAARPTNLHDVWHFTNATFPKAGLVNGFNIYGTDAMSYLADDLPIDLGGTQFGPSKSQRALLIR